MTTGMIYCNPFLFQNFWIRDWYRTSIRQNG